MPRLLTVFLCLLTGLAGHYWLEVRQVRADQDEMLYRWGNFLALKVKGKPLSDRLKVGSVALFKVKGDMVACAIMR